VRRFSAVQASPNVAGMLDNEPTARSREIGLIFAKAAKEARYNGVELGRRLDWSESKVSRILSGKRAPSRDDVVAFATLTRLKGAEREEVLELVERATEPAWLQDFGDKLPARLRTLASYEEIAAEIINFETGLIPGLLQVPAYTRAVFRTNASVLPAEVDARIIARTQRQNLLTRPKRPNCVFYIDEYAVRRTGPGSSVMAVQVHHLLRIAALPNVSIRIIPDNCGLHAGHKPYHMMKFHELRPVIFLEDETGVQFLHRARTIETYQRITDRLARVALTEEESRIWLARVARALGAPRKERDDLEEEHVQ
jgi:hypothetical protein